MALSTFETCVLRSMESPQRGDYFTAVDFWEATRGLEETEQLRRMMWGGFELLYCAYGPLSERPTNNTVVDANDFHIPRVVYIEIDRPKTSRYVVKFEQPLSKVEESLSGQKVDFRDIPDYLLSSRSQKFRWSIEYEMHKLAVLNEIAHNSANFNKMPALAVALMTKVIMELKAEDCFVPGFLPVFLFVASPLREKYGGFGGIQIGSVHGA